MVGQQTYRDLAQRETDLQKQLIKISEENIELRFECEQAKKDIPRLKVCTSAFEITSTMFSSMCYIFVMCCVGAR